MNRKFAAAFLSVAFVGVAGLLAEAQDIDNVPMECIGNGTTPPYWDNQNHYPDKGYCCTGYKSGSNLIGESVRWWSPTVPRTKYDGTPDMGCVPPP
jgi:hypothetical protein